MITVPPDVPSVGAYAVLNRSTGPASADDDGDADAPDDSDGLSAAVDGAAADGAGVVLVPPHAATKMAAPANRPTSFRIKAPPSCVGSWGNCSLAGPWPWAPDASGQARDTMGGDAHTRMHDGRWAAFAQRSLTPARVS